MRRCGEDPGGEGGGGEGQTKVRVGVGDVKWEGQILRAPSIY